MRALRPLPRLSSGERKDAFVEKRDPAAKHGAISERVRKWALRVMKSAELRELSGVEEAGASEDEREGEGGLSQ